MDTCDAPDDTISFEVEGRGIAFVVEGGMFVSGYRIGSNPDYWRRSTDRTDRPASLPGKPRMGGVAKFGVRTMHDTYNFGRKTMLRG